MIGLFRNEYYFLSNFYESKIEFEGLIYNNTESAFQAMKCINVEDRVKFLNLTGSQAKYKGRRVKLREDWDGVKLYFMYLIVYQKFIQNEILIELLKQTTINELVEINTWGDKFWGVNTKGEGLIIYVKSLWKFALD